MENVTDVLEQVTVSQQIIEVIDNLCDKFGVAVDWTSQNVLPYLVELMHRICYYKIAMAVGWALLFSIPLIVLIVILYGHIKNVKLDKDYIAGGSSEHEEVLLSYVMIIFAIIIILIAIFVNAQVILQAVFVPELTVYNYIYGIIG